MVLQSQGKNSEAQALLQELTQHRGFYPMVAAEKLGKPYVMVIKRQVFHPQFHSNLKCNEYAN